MQTTLPKLLAKNSATFLTTHLPAPPPHFQGLLSSLLCESIVRKGGKLQWNETETLNNLEGGSAPRSEPQGSRLGQGWEAFSTGSAPVCS